MNPSRSKTQKNKCSYHNKKDLWNQFDEATKGLECVYSSETSDS